MTKFYVTMEGGEFRYGASACGDAPTGPELVTECDSIDDAYDLCAKFNAVLNAHHEKTRPNGLVPQDVSLRIRESTGRVGTIADYNFHTSGGWLVLASEGGRTLEIKLLELSSGEPEQGYAVAARFARHSKLTPLEVLRLGDLRAMETP